ncbi:DUF4468 domain-containing protein [Sphingobacterium sp. MYb382]|uniref:DUF4468 domain-containing protein n=1 Tax=Sphingobacterium sp. MYb382 TaxID=2745278 RepID=UPI0030961D67
MMRSLVLFFLLFTLFIFGQNDVDRVTMPTKNGKIFYEDVVAVDANLSKDVLFLRGLKWSAGTTKDLQAPNWVHDKEAGRIIGNVIFNDLANGIPDAFRHYSFMVDITVKDGKYRVQLYDVKYQLWEGKNFLGKQYYFAEEEYEKQLNQNRYLYRGTSLKRLRALEEKLKATLVELNELMKEPATADDF